jgi:hypothetical protein
VALWCEAPLHVVLWTPLKQKKVLDIVIYEFNQSKAIAIYEKNLTDVITPKSC